MWVSRLVHGLAFGQILPVHLAEHDNPAIPACQQHKSHVSVIPWWWNDNLAGWNLPDTIPSSGNFLEGIKKHFQYTNLITAF
jgi:hypothetical protein